MRTILKYEIEIADRIMITLHRGAKFRYLAVQDGRLFAWFEVNPEEPDWPLAIAIVGTGRPIPFHPINPTIYLGSVQMPPFTWHVYMTAPGGFDQ